MPIRIRPRHRADDDRLLKVWRASVEGSHPFLTAPNVDWYETIVAEYLPQMRDVRVAVDETREVVGFIAQDAGQIHMLLSTRPPTAEGSGPPSSKTLPQALQRSASTSTN